MKCYRQNLPEIDRQKLPVAEPTNRVGLVGYRRNCRFQQGLPGAASHVTGLQPVRYAFCI